MKLYKDVYIIKNKIEVLDYLLNTADHVNNILKIENLNSMHMPYM